MLDCPCPDGVTACKSWARTCRTSSTEELGFIFGFMSDLAQTLLALSAVLGRDGWRKDVLGEAPKQKGSSKR
jgi:hypothetical protein